MQKTSLRNGQMSTPPQRTGSNRTPLSELDADRKNKAAQEDYLPAPTPGQPRKTARADRHHPYSRSGSNTTPVDEEITIEQETEITTIHRRSGGVGESDEELHLRMRSHRKTSQSPGRSEKNRSFSQTTSAVYIDNDASQDAENIGGGRPKAVDRVASTPAVLAKVRSSKRSAESPLRAKESGGIRKTSSRVASQGPSATVASAVRKVSAQQ
jgi:cell division cycle 14